MAVLPGIIISNSNNKEEQDGIIVTTMELHRREEEILSRAREGLIGGMRVKIELDVWKI